MNLRCRENQNYFEDVFNMFECCAARESHATPYSTALLFTVHAILRPASFDSSVRKHEYVDTQETGPSADLQKSRQTSNQGRTYTLQFHNVFYSFALGMDFNVISWYFSFLCTFPYFASLTTDQTIGSDIKKLCA